MLRVVCRKFRAAAHAGYGRCEAQHGSAGEGGPAEEQSAYSYSGTLLLSRKAAGRAAFREAVCGACPEGGSLQRT